jgi:hypothetical protein
MIVYFRVSPVLTKSGNGSLFRDLAAVKGQYVPTPFVCQPNTTSTLQPQAWNIILTKVITNGGAAKASSCPLEPLFPSCASTAGLAPTKDNSSRLSEQPLGPPTASYTQTGLTICGKV